jgi:hypothetical protein
MSSLCMTWALGKPRKPRRALLRLPSRYGCPGHNSAGGREGREEAPWCGKQPETPPLAKAGGTGAQGCAQRLTGGGETSGGAAISRQTATRSAPTREPIRADWGGGGQEAWGRGGNVRRRGRCRAQARRAHAGAAPGRTTMTARGGAGLFLGKGNQGGAGARSAKHNEKPNPQKSEGPYRPGHSHTSAWSISYQ